MPVTYWNAAQLGFNELVALYTECAKGNFDANFWHGANTLHAALDFLVLSHQPDKDHLLLVGEGLYTKLKSNPDWWRDDYAWWGNVFMQAWSNRSTLTPLATRSTTLPCGRACWLTARIAGNSSTTPGPTNPMPAGRPRRGWSNRDRGRRLQHDARGPEGTDKATQGC